MSEIVKPEFWAWANSDDDEIWQGPCVSQVYLRPNSGSRRIVRELTEKEKKALG